MTSTPSPSFPVNHGKISYYTCSDGQKLRIGEWGSTTNPRGKLIFNHGFTEHIGVYDELFQRLSSRGYYIIAFDQRGAGEQCQGKKYGITNELFVQDDLNSIIKEFLIQDRELEDVKKDNLFMWGHSMGGGITLNYGVKGKYRDLFKGFIGCAPLIQLHPASNPNFVLRKALSGLSRAWPTLHFPAELKLSHIVGNPVSQQRLDTDEWIRPMCTVKQMYDMLKRGNDLVDPEYVKKYKPDASVLIYHSEVDKINWYVGSKKFVDLLPIEDKELYEAKGCEHSIHLEEPEKEEKVFEKLVSFLNERTNEVDN